MSLVPPRGERALPALAGATLALAYPPVELLVPAFVGLVPLLVFIAGRPPGPEGRWSAVRGGMLAGLIYFGLQLYWLVVALIYYSALAIPAYLGTVLILTGFTGAFAWAVHYTRDRLGLSPALAATLFWPTLEWVQGHLGDLSFPWLGLGSALAPFPTLAGAADLVGARGLTVWIAAVNGVLAVLVLRHRAGRPLRGLALGLAALVAGPAAYGFARAATLELRPAARVAVVQPNIPEDLKMDRRVAMDTSLTALTRLTLELEPAARGQEPGPEPDGAGGASGGAGPATAGLDLVAWPEVALPGFPEHDGGLTAVVRELSRRVGAPILLGAYGVDGTGDDAVAFNSAFLVDGTGLRPPRYDKRRLVPFVERIPFVDPAWFEALVGSVVFVGGLGKGRERAVLPTDGGSGFGTLICYESIFAPLSRRYRRDGAD
ncbi:MAG: apolipoprotein N-acyltransferase, partial [Gemmatimonadota bacterium]